MKTTDRTEIKLVHTRSHEILDQDADGFGRLKPSAAALIMQDLAQSHTAEYGDSQPQLYLRGAVWVLARTRATFTRLPFSGESLTVTTWPGKTVRSLFPRYYTFAVGEEKVGAAVTFWTLVDTEKHEMTDPESRGVYVAGEPALPAPFENPPRLREKGEPLFETARRCCYSDIDRNRHMNNARYVEWLCDVLSPETTPSGFQVNYLSEIREADEVRLLVYENDLVVGVRPDGVRAFEGRLEYR